eukprot:5946783-Amphidinium_carterae.4
MGKSAALFRGGLRPGLPPLGSALGRGLVLHPGPGVEDFHPPLRESVEEQETAKKVESREGQHLRAAEGCLYDYWPAHRLDTPVH